MCVLFMTLNNLEFLGMKSAPLLPSLPGPLWLGVVSLDRVLSIGQTELNCAPMLNVGNRTVFDIQTAHLC